MEDSIYTDMTDILTDVADHMRRVAKHLIPYTHPRKTFEYEQDILCLKQRKVHIDGYYVMLCFSIADYTLKDEHMLKSLQVQSVHTPFLPFNIICKLGRSFLGSKNLSYVEFMRAKKKVYCWTIKTQDGLPMLPAKQSVPGSYEGFEYNILDPRTVDLL